MSIKERDVSVTAYVRVTGSGQITIPAELRRKHGISIGDRVAVTEDERGQLVIGKRLRTVAELDGIFPLLPGVEADPDFGNIIREAMEENAERVVREMRGEYDDE
jgi:AbrB family looped-hinge helix DNA binding protein